MTSRPSRIPPPGPSFIREEPVTLPGPGGTPGKRVRAGMSRPSVMEDGWWLCHVWVAGDDGLIPALDAAPNAGPPPGSPVAAIGPRLAGALAGLIAQEQDRQLIRIRMPAADDESRPWERPMLCMLAIKWDPVRASVMRENELARELLRGFAAAVEGVGRPG